MASSAERAAVSAILRDCSAPVIVDLGAYDGSDSEWMIEACTKRPRVIMVEADRRNYLRCQTLSTKVLEKAQVSLYHAAIASYTGMCNFYACDNKTQQAIASGSIRKPTGHIEHFPWCTFREAEVIQCFALDSLVSQEGLRHIDILWVDVQGAERDVISGGEVALNGTRYLMVESEQTELYAGQALRPELLNLLPGWDVVAEFDYNLLLRNTRYVG